MSGESLRRGSRIEACEVAGSRDSRLSKHVATLAEAGYVRSRKGTHDGRRTTWVALSPTDLKVLRNHVAALRKIIDGVD